MSDSFTMVYSGDQSDQLLRSVDHFTDEANRFSVPEHLIDGLVNYIVRGTPTGDFLRCALEDRLTDTIGRADEVSLSGLTQIVKFIYNVVPAISRGRGVAAWIERGGLIGRPTVAVEPEPVLEEE